MGVSSGPLTPLNGLVVLDLSRHLPGPLLTRMLKDLGAEVVKVEPPTGDPAPFHAAHARRGWGALHQRKCR